jgi:hypothetical protein
MSTPTPPTAEPANPGRAPFPRPALPGTGQATPASAAGILARHLNEKGITGIYAAACDRYALISIAAGLTVWTNGRVLWWDHPRQAGTWPAADPVPAAARLAALVRPGTAMNPGIMDLPGVERTSPFWPAHKGPTPSSSTELALASLLHT